MEFRSRIFADSQGQTIDAIGKGRFIRAAQLETPELTSEMKS